MKKRMLLILSALILLVGCVAEGGSVDGQAAPNPAVTTQEQTPDESIEKGTIDEEDHSISESNRETPTDKENAEQSEKDIVLPEAQENKAVPQETLAINHGLPFQDDSSLLAVLPMPSKEDFSSEEWDFPINDFRILLFTTMDDGETKDFLLIPRYVGTTIQLYESGDEGTLPIYSYALDEKDIVLLRIGANHKDVDYRIVVSYEDEEVTWVLSERQEDTPFVLEGDFEQSDKKQG